MVSIATLCPATALPMQRLGKALSRMAIADSKKLTAAAGKKLPYPPSLTSRCPAQGMRRLMPHHKFGKNGQQSYSFSNRNWLLPLGAAALFANTKYNNNASCLTTGYSIFEINEYITLVTISDTHVDKDYPVNATIHIKQAGDLVAYLKAQNTPVDYYVEYKKGYTQYILEQDDHSMCVPIKDAIKNNMQTGSIAYTSFDLRQTPYLYIACISLYPHELVDTCKEHLIQAQNTIENARIPAKTKAIINNILTKKYSENIVSLTEAFNEFETLNAPIKELTGDEKLNILANYVCAIECLPSNAKLLCDIFENIESPSTNKRIIAVHAGAAHIAPLAEATAKALQAAPQAQEGVLYPSELDKCLYKKIYPLINNYGDTLIQKLKAIQSERRILNMWRLHEELL
jgi:hypothetical protein